MRLTPRFVVSFRIVPPFRFTVPMTDSYTDLLQSLRVAKRVLITTHVKPDGDALGSTAAMALALKHQNIDAEVLLLSKLPSKYAFIYEEAGIRWTDVEAGFPQNFSLEAYDTLLVIDTGTWSQLPGLKPHVEQFAGRKLVVDHHLTQEDWADQKLVVTAAAAAGEIVAELIAQWNIALDAKIAAPLYVALVADTGWFQYSNTRPYTMRLAAQLMEAGVDTDAIYQRLYQNERPQRVLLQAAAMQTLELLVGGRVAIMHIRPEDLVRTQATTSDTEGMINLPLQVRDVQVSIVLSQPAAGEAVRVSFRSKGQLDCAKFAEAYGGGGHARAAGAKIQDSLEAVKSRLIADLTARLG